MYQLNASDVGVFFFLRDVLLSEKKIRPEFHYSNFEFKWGN